MSKSVEIFQDKTIVAISTPAGRGGIGIVRLSGITAVDIALHVFRNKNMVKVLSLKNRYANYGFIVDENEEKIDEVLLTVMYSPASYTCEDLVEISCHGGSYPVRKIEQILLGSGARLAEPGEFSKRAFLNGRIDLVQAEAVAELVSTHSGTAFKTAFSQLDGHLSVRLAQIENIIIDLLTTLEADIDFPEDEIDDAGLLETCKKFESLTRQISEMIRSYDYGRIYKEGISVAVIGEPNVGKSSLLNGLLERDRVIVSEEPGTTRDMVEEELSLSGIAVRIIDTAGIRESGSFVEKEGIRRSFEVAQNADLLLIIVDGSIKGIPGILDQVDIDNLTAPYIFVINKSDLPQRIDKHPLKGHYIVYISAKYMKGLEKLKNMIVSTILPESENFTESVVVTRKRHVELLQAMLTSVKRAEAGFDKNLSSEFISADLEEAKSALSRLTGKSVTEEVINKIFNDFCIGK